MYLKSLVLKGFKSFADRSVLTVEPGITAIVGPNGSGKSNISDAVLWVLGERSAKNLRGQAMEDIIFSGSAARKAVSVAEVELVLDNSDGTVPVDYDEVEIGHRHISQLFALHPAELITPNKTPKLADAARATLVRRLIHGGGHTGWSCAWITNMWARLYDSRMVYENLKKLLAHSTSPNMMDTLPPFQIDGNFGGIAAIAEALLQSVAGEIVLLPALPVEWNTGHIKGLRAKGGFGVDIEWRDGKLLSAEISSDNGGECRLRTNCVVSVVCKGESVSSRIEDGAIIFDTTAGSVYTIKS